MAVPIFVTVSGVTLALFVALVVVLSKRVAGLATSIAAFQQEIAPVLEGIRREAEKVRAGAERLDRARAEARRHVPDR